MANLRVNEITTGVGSYNGSIYATGTSSYLFTTVTAPGTDDFTIECYINTDAASSGTQDGIFAINASSGGFQSTTTNQIRLALGRAGGGGQNGGLEVNINGTAVDCGSNDIIQEGTWHHVAVTRSSGTVQIWVDGVEKGSGTAAGEVTGTTFVTGYYDGLYTYQGFMSNFRYRKGTAHYTTTFTAPTKPLERTTDTELIFAQSPHNPSDGFSSAIHGGTTDIMQVNGNVTANESSPTQLSDTSAVGVVYDGPIKHNTQGYMYFPTGRTVERGRGRGIIHGGYNGPSSFGISGVLSAVEIASDGVASKFGDLTETRYTVATVGSSTRSVFIGGAMPVSPSPFYTVNNIDFVEIATTGNAQDFGDSDEVGYNKTGVSSSTRGVYTQGRIYNPSAGSGSNAIEFITIASKGNGQDFGQLVGGGRVTLCNAAMSSTRGILAGGILSPVPPPSTNFTNIIEFVTMATLGNSVNFGELDKTGGRSNGNCSSSTRAVFSVATQSPADGNVLNFVTIASTGDAQDFGDLSGGQQMRGACSNQIRGLFAGGFVAPGSSNYVNTCERITIATTGSATDWGDPFETETGRAYNSGISDSHGGLS